MQNDQAAKPSGVTRRELLAWTWVVAAAVVSIKLLQVTYAVVRPARTGEGPTIFDIGPLTDLMTTGAAPQPFPDGHFWVAQTGDSVVALDGVCTHLDCLLGWDAPTRQFVCPCHGSRFDATGAHLAGPASRAMDRYDLHMIDNNGAVVASADSVTGVLPLPDSDLGEAVAAAASHRLIVDISHEIPGSAVA